MSARTAAAIGIGLMLASSPFVRYRFGAPHPTAHANHAPRHGGEVVMVGDAHLELVRGGRSIEVFGSDSYRRPIAFEGGTLALADGTTLALVAEQGRLVARRGGATGRVEATIAFGDGRKAIVTFGGETGG